MRLAVHLLGPPSVEVDGVAAPAPRGTKTWALLAYLLLSRGPVPRSRVASLLFGQADDPVGALRWTLSQMRRLLGDGARVTGDPLALRLPAGTVVDAAVVTQGSWAEAQWLPGLGADLLEGVTVKTGAAFELWLSAERRRLSGATQALLHEAAVSRLARGDPTSASALASRLVAMDPLDENSHVLLVRCLQADGDTEAAQAQVASCQALFREELGVDPGPSLVAASRGAAAGEAMTTGRAAVLAQLDAGAAAGSAGAYDVAVESLRRAVVGARGTGDAQLLARALLALGSTFVHGVRGCDEEGLPALHEADTLAQRCGAAAIAATARRELGYVEALRGNYPRMERWLADATAVAAGDHGELAWIEAVAGLGRSDVADYAPAVASLECAQDHARSAGDDRALAFAATALGRVHVLRGELDHAKAACDRAYATASKLQWTSFLPWTEIFLGEVALRRGDTDQAAERLDHAYALGRQIGDPCWESGAMRGLGLVAARRGQDTLALDLLTQAPRVCRRLTDTYAWVEGYGQEALCSHAVDRGLDSATQWIEDLDAFAAKRGMRELVARAARHRASMGQPGAAEAASLLSNDIENPALQ